MNAKLFILPVYDDLATRIADPNKINTPHTITVNRFESSILEFQGLRYKIETKIYFILAECNPFLIKYS